jgi:hypothetical protein
MHVISMSNLMDFSFLRKFLRNFAKIVLFSHDFCIFGKIEKCIFVSTLYKIHYWLSIKYQYFEVFSYGVKRFFTLGFFIKQSWFTGWRRWLMASYSPRKFSEIVRNSADTNHYGIPRNFAEFSSIPWHGIPNNSAEFLAFP